ncbi:UxaA family hydrolase [Aliiroseovarius halocynthiae]|uniref:D-galactarate/Altronate dehydratase C-terminal domain-containing protein n=1 Tax=Aliiroseovarius halocynthiae TaxID=985055 RepID=A0A545SNI8_9RHOB|nr:hypothetical protein FIL88_12455 [Aliiroseovarius halocynthiae]
MCEGLCVSSQYLSPSGGLKIREQVKAKGIVFVDPSEYVSTLITQEVASGFNSVCFTTGRGFCYGSKLEPSNKTVSHTPMCNRMSGGVVINRGVTADSAASV